MQEPTPDPPRPDTLPSTKKDLEPEGVELLGFSVARFPVAFQFALLCGGVFTWTVFAAFFAESTFVKAGEFKIGWLMTVAETGMSSFCAFLLRQAKPYPRRAPLKDYALLGVYYMMARVLSNLSVDYTDYPTQVVVKSSKVIPAMILGFWILKKRYAFLEYATAILLVSGIIVFTLAGSSATPTFSGIGVAFGATSVIFDGVVGNTQEKLMKGQGVMETEMILFMNFFSFLYCFAGGLVTGIAADTVKFVWTFPEGPKAILGMLLLSAFMQFLGLSWVATFVKRFGTVVTMMTTSSRKVITVTLSYIAFPKPVSGGHFVGGGLVFIAIVMELYMKTRGAK